MVAVSRGLGSQLTKTGSQNINDNFTIASVMTLREDFFSFLYVPLTLQITLLPNVSRTLLPDVSRTFLFGKFS